MTALRNDELVAPRGSGAKREATGTDPPVPRPDPPVVEAGVRGNPHVDRAPGPRPDHVAAQLDVADLNLEGRGSRSRVPGRVDRPQPEPVDARLRRHPVPLAPLQRVRAERLHLDDLSPVRIEHRARRLARVEEDGEVVVDGISVGRDDLEACPRERDVRSLGVDRDRVRQQDRPVLAGEVDARPVDPVRDRRARVLTPVPSQLLRAWTHVMRRNEGSDDVVVAINDRDRQIVGFAHAKVDGHPTPRSGRDDLAHPRREDRAALELQPLGDGEGRGRAAE